MTSLPVLNETQKNMIHEFQCPGCVCGSDTDCGAYKPEHDEGMFRCNGHVAGTNVVMPGYGMFTMILGLPKGFHRLGPQARSEGPKMRMWEKGHHPDWDKFNVPVWAMEKEVEGKRYLFVRTFMPRNNYPMIDVVEEGTLDMCPGAINVGEFYDEID